MNRALAPHHHPTVLHAPTVHGLSADAWSYAGARIQEVYVELFGGGRHIVTVKVRVPIPRPKKGKKA